jgi:iron(III) transport system substrate-binding protein
MTRKQRPSRRDVLKGGAALLVAGLSAGRAQAEEAQTPREKELYQAAQKEGALTWYMSHSNDVTAQALGRGFEAKYPGIKVSAVRTTAQVAFQRVSQELRAGAMQVDVLSSTDLGHYAHLKEMGLLANYVPENASKISDVYKNPDPDGYSFVTSAGLIGIGYNSSQLKDADAPKGWTDLLDPKWKDKVAVGHPGFSGYVGTWTVMMRKLYGWQFFEKLAKNNPQIGRSINDSVTMLNAGERMIAATGYSGAILESAQKGNPLRMIYPPAGTVLILAPSGIMKGARHPNASQLFMEYLLGIEASKIWVEHFGESMRPEVPPFKGGKSAKDLKTIRPTADEITKGVPEVVKQWRDTFGV